MDVVAGALMGPVAAAPVVGVGSVLGAIFGL